MTIRGQGVYENNGLDLVNRRVKKRFVKRSISDFSINITIAPLIDKKVLEVKYNFWLYRFCCKIILQILDKLIIHYYLQYCELVQKIEAEKIGNGTELGAKLQSGATRSHPQIEEIFIFGPFTNSLAPY